MPSSDQPLKWPTDPKPIVGNEILTFKEGGVWVACWTLLDVVSQASTERGAISSLLETIAYQCVLSHRHGHKPLEHLPPPTAAVLEYWRKKHAEDHR